MKKEKTKKKEAWPVPAKKEAKPLKQAVPFKLPQAPIRTEAKPVVKAAKPLPEAKPVVKEARKPVEQPSPLLAEKQKPEAANPEAKPLRVREGPIAGLRRRVFNIYKGIFRLVRTTYQRRVQQLLDYAGIPADVDVWLGSRLAVALLFGLFMFLLPFTIGYYTGFVTLETPGEIIRTLLASFLAGAFTFFFILFLYYLHLYYTIDDRTKRVERVLPDFLLMVSANMHAGMTPFTAFHVSARPEFGPLEEVIRLVAAKTMGTESLSTAFAEIPRYVNSAPLRKTVSFFEKGIRSGGHLARLLESSAEELRETEELKRELITSTKTYTIFLIFIVIIGIPLLFAISSQFVGTFAKIQSQQKGAEAVGELGVSFFTGELSLKPEFIIQASYVLLVLTSFLVSILIGVIGEGKLLYGIKYFIPVAVASAVCFTLIRGVLGSLLQVVGG